jgi:hypothetical protein
MYTLVTKGRFTTALLANTESKWSIRKLPNGLGDYGYNDFYAYAGKPFGYLEVCYNPPKTKAYLWLKGPSSPKDT